MILFYWWVIQLLIIRNRINVFIEALSNVMQSLLNACSNILGVRGLAPLPIAYSGPAHGSPIARSGLAWVPPIAPSGLAWGPPTPYCPFEPWQGPAHCPLPIRTQLVSHLTSYIMLCHIMFDILYQRPLYIIYLILHVTYIICAFMCNPVSLATCFRVLLCILVHMRMSSSSSLTLRPAQIAACSDRCRPAKFSHNFGGSQMCCFFNVAE